MTIDTFRMTTLPGHDYFLDCHEYLKGRHDYRHFHMTILPKHNDFYAYPHLFEREGFSLQ